MQHGLITDTVSVYDFARTGDTEEHGATASITGLDVGIFPAGPDIVALYGGVGSYALFEIFVYEPCTIKTGAKIVSGSTTYQVQGVAEVIDNRYMYYQRLVAMKTV